jgi:hypothetical protein
MIQEMDLYGKVAVRFLTSIPSCCYSDVHTEVTSSGENSQVDDHSSEEKRTTLNPEELSSLSSDFLTYLLDVRKNLSDRRMACSCWSAHWDGLDPSYEPVDTSEKPLSNGSMLHSSTSSPEISQLCKDDGKPASKRSLSVENDKLEVLLGPFITRLFKKLEKMPENSIAVNEVLIGIISSLAEYPQPLLRSFLLNHSLVLQPEVKSIFQVKNNYRGSCCKGKFCCNLHRNYVIVH